MLGYANIQNQIYNLKEYLYLKFISKIATVV